jgi:hypothetical protein
MNGAFNQYRQMVESGDAQENPLLLDTLMTTALMGVAASPVGAKLAKASYDILGNLKGDAVKAAGSQYVNIQDGMAIITQMTPEGTTSRVVAPTIDGWDNRVSFNTYKRFKGSIDHLATLRDTGKISDEAAFAQVDTFEAIVVEEELLSADLARAEAMGKIDALDQPMREQRAREQGFRTLRLQADGFLKGLTNGHYGSNYEIAAEQWKREAEKFMLEDPVFLDVANTYRVPVDGMRETYRRFIDSQAELIKAADPAKLRGKESDARAQALLNKKMVLEDEMLAFEGLIPVGTRCL